VIELLLCTKIASTKVLFLVVLATFFQSTNINLPALVCEGNTCTNPEMKASRTLTKVAKSMSVSDGAGVKLKRSIGAVVDNVDPFLLLDEFKSDSADDYIAGFPDHPHRGFETVSYMLAGSMEHRDHKGNHGILTAGSIQWMTAGRGIIHSEMPKQDNGLMWGFQLWINLPAKHKMCEPRYQDIPPADIPIVTQPNGAVIKVLAGEVGEVHGPVKGVVTNPTYIDVTLPPNTHYIHTLPVGHSAFVYVFEGSCTFGPSHNSSVVNIGHIGVFSTGDQIEARATEGATTVGRFILIAAQPLNEPIARRGPFVMNTKEELAQAYIDYQSGRF
jgi:hypothetical protein